MTNERLRKSHTGLGKIDMAALPPAAQVGVTFNFMLIVSSLVIVRLCFVNRSTVKMHILDGQSFIFGTLE